MNTWILIISSSLCTLWLEQTSAQTSFREFDLPAAAGSLIEAQIGPWVYFSNAIPAFDSTGVQTAWEYADIIMGDFNGDSRSDYAVLVRRADSTLGNEGFLFAIFRADDTFNAYLVATLRYSDDLVLMLDRKGTKLHDFETDNEFVLPVDGIFLYYYEKAGSTYYYQEREFRQIHSSD